ncbi:MAG: formylglycine-generating enzyme family protein, partial [Saprospiraceae bacterium]
MYEPILMLLKALENEGFPIGVDTCLRVAAVWKNLPHPLDMDAACDFLCPLVAQGPAEQEKFRQWFPRYAHLLGIVTQAAEPENVKAKEVPVMVSKVGPKPRRRVYAAFTALLAAVLSIALFWYFQSTVEKKPQTTTGKTVGKELQTTADTSGAQPQNKDIGVAPTGDAPGLPGILQDTQNWLIYDREFLFSLLSLLLLTGGAGLFFWLRAQRRYAARQEKGDEPPYQLPIKINRADAITVRPEFVTAVNRLRSRETSERLRISLPRTIAATVRQGGLLEIRFDNYTRPVEYLLLIDKNSGQNHQSQLFEYVYQHLLRQEVHAERFFFDGTPLWCWNERYPEGIPLGRVKHLYRDARLLVLSNGYGLISAVTGELEDWSLQLADWKRRALLTPAPMAAWNYREATLADLFPVMPSRVEGIAQVVRYFEKLPTPNLRDWKYDLGANDSPVPIHPEKVADSLSQHLRPEVLRWVAACALYPELHWDLTLRLGEVLSPTGAPPLATFENVAVLARLPWFQKGVMPNAVRRQLLESGILDENDRRLARSAIVRVLEDNIPDNPKSYAFNEHQLHLAINELLLARVPREKKRWLQQYRELYGQGIKGDSVSIVELDRRFNKLLDFPLPRRLGDFLFPEGRSILGLRPRTPILLACCLAFCMWALGRFLSYKASIDRIPTNLVEALSANMVRVRGGTFTMGCTVEQGGDCYDWEKPTHQVTVSDYYIGKYEVTQKEWREVMG